MTSQVLQYNQQVPIGEVNGMPVFASWDFLRYMEDYRSRVGGNVAMTNTEIAADLSYLHDLANAAALGVFERPKHQATVRSTTPTIGVTKDAVGYVLDFNVGDVIAAVMPFIPRTQPTPQRSVDDASQILAARVFRA